MYITEIDIIETILANTQTMLLAFLIFALPTFFAHGTASSANPPFRGWNSYDSYCWCINETQFLDNARGVSKYLKQYGYNYVVIDFLWFQNISNSTDVFIDKYGRPQPDPVRFPHGMAYIADQVHEMGLKFGIHIMRGVTSKAIHKNTPILNISSNTTVLSGATTKDIYLESNDCPWHSSMYGINTSHPDSRPFIQSLYYQYFNEWNVDFIKNDCMYGGNFVYDQIVQVSSVIDELNKDCIYSLSPGNYSAPNVLGNKIDNIVSSYRITGDTWDKWDEIKRHFIVSGQFANATDMIGHTPGLGSYNTSYPDLDMLPIGYIAEPIGNNGIPNETGFGPNRMCNLTQSQQRCLFTLWSIMKSPLLFGGLVYDRNIANYSLVNDTFTYSLLINEYALKVNSYGYGIKQISSSYDSSGDTMVESVWRTQVMNNNELEYYVGLFNLGDEIKSINVSLNQIVNNVTRCHATNCYTKEKMNVTNVIQQQVPPNDVLFFQLTQCK